MRYRTDRIETTEQGQRVGYVDWIGGPTITKVHAICPDGQSRWAHVTGEPCTWFSLPAYVNNGGAGRVTGWLGTDDGVWTFHPHTDQQPIAWRPTRKPEAASC
jgi:hypothetical protein